MVKKFNPNPTKRELEILNLLFEGKSSADIARKLELSIHTVNNHRKHLLHKSHCKNSTELVRWALKKGLIDQT